jgi:phosphate transport system substrate-binding protein
VELPKGASYVRPDGAIYIVGHDGMEEMLKQFNQLFAKTHPGFRFEMLLKGSATALSGLTAGVSAFAPIAREARPYDEVRPFRQIYGYEPTAIRIGRVGYAGPGRKNPPGTYVNARNPLAGLTVEQVARIFTTGGGTGDLTHWSQLGLSGQWGTRVIHVYGPRDDGGFATALRTAKMGAFAFTHRYEPLPEYADIIEAVADDPYGIGFVGFFDSNRLPPEVKLVPLAEKEGAPYSTGGYADVLEGRYAYTPGLHLYVNRAPGQPLDPFLKEYARLALSREGQAIITAQREGVEGYLPLQATEVAQSLARLE